MKKILFIIIACLYTCFAYSSNISKSYSFNIPKEIKAVDLILPLNKVKFIDPSGNRAIDTNEQCELQFNVVNNGTIDAINYLAKINITGMNKGLTYERFLSLPTIPKGKSISVTIPVQSNMQTVDGKVNIEIYVDEKNENGNGTDKVNLTVDVNAFDLTNVDKHIPQSEQIINNTFVLIISNENYQMLPDVPAALNDGLLFYNYCNQTLGIPENYIRHIKDAKLSDIITQLAWIREHLSIYNGAAKVILYYAGNCVSNEKDNTSYLLPIDAIGNSVSEGYKFDNLYTLLGENVSSESITILYDACFTNEKGNKYASNVVKSKLGQPKGNMVVLSAAQREEMFYTNNAKKHGMFTYFLLSNLQETSGNITLYDLSTYIINNVSRYSKQIKGNSNLPVLIASPTIGTEWHQWQWNK